MVVEVLHYIYPKHCLEEEWAKSIVRRMCDWGIYRLELTLLGREALICCWSARPWHVELDVMYRKRLVWFHEKIHSSFMRECISLLIRDTKGKAPKWEIEAIYQTAARRSPLRAREYALEQAVLRPQLRNRKGANRKVEFWIGDEPLPLHLMPLRSQLR